MNSRSPSPDCNMLPSFKVRDLQHPIPTRPISRGASIPYASYDPLVKITAPEYDSTISDHPEATLKYVDDDDGEIVTVGGIFINI